MSVPPDQPADPGPDGAGVGGEVIRARAEQLRVSLRAAAADCDVIIGGEAGVRLIPTDAFAAAEQELFDFVVTHHQDLEGIRWAHDLYVIHHEDLHPGPGEVQEADLSPPAGGGFPPEALHQLAVHLARPDDLIVHAGTVELKFSVEDTIRRGLEHILRHDPTKGPGLDGVDPPSL